MKKEEEKRKTRGMRASVRREGRKDKRWKERTT